MGTSTQIERLKDGTASSIGGIILGSILGISIDIYLSTDLTYDFPLNNDNILLPPILLSTLFGSISFYLVTFSENGDIVNNILGTPTKKIIILLNTIIQNKIQNTLSYIKSIPNQIKTSIQNKID